MSDTADILPPFDFLEELPPAEQAALLRAILDVLPDAVIAHGPDGDLIYWSDGLCEMLGYTREEVRGLKPFGWVHPEAIRGAPGRLETILHDGGLTFESKAVRKDGSVLPTLVTARRIDTRKGPLVVSVIRDMSSLKAAQESIAHLANHDPLTGALNRPAFYGALEHALLDAERHGDIVAVVCLDVDDLRSINDRSGHRFGDQVLITLVERLREVVRGQDRIARLAGDELAVLLSRIGSPSDVGAIVERIVEAASAPITTDSGHCAISVTCGAALYEHGTDTADRLVMKAEVALYRAQAMPQRRWLLWSEELGGAEAGRPW